MCANLNPKKNPSINLYCGFRKSVCANLNPKNIGIDFYSGFKKNGHIEIQKKSGIYFNSGLRKIFHGGVQFEILNIIQVRTFIVASGKPLKGWCNMKS